jgi:hypothetical protein
MSGCGRSDSQDQIKTNKAEEAWLDWDSLFDLMRQPGTELKPKVTEGMYSDLLPVNVPHSKLDFW